MASPTANQVERGRIEAMVTKPGRHESYCYSNLLKTRLWEISSFLYKILILDFPTSSWPVCFTQGSFLLLLDPHVTTIMNLATRAVSATNSTAYKQFDSGKRSRRLNSRVGGFTNGQTKHIGSVNGHGAMVGVMPLEDNTLHQTPKSHCCDGAAPVTSSDTRHSPRRTSKPLTALSAKSREALDTSFIDTEFLRRQEEIAYESFIKGDFNEAEQCLHQALQCSHGDPCEHEDLSKLKLQWALYCCLLGEWDKAATIVSELSSSEFTPLTSIYDLRQAIAIALLHEGRLKDAYSTCKPVYEAKKKLLRRDDNDYLACLSLLANICEKRGNITDARSYRQSMPQEWALTNSKDTISPVGYILSRPLLLESILGRKVRICSSQWKAAQLCSNSSKSAKPTGSYGTSPPATASAYRPTSALGGQTRAQRAEPDQARWRVGETDMGKEVTVQNAQPDLRSGDKKQSRSFGIPSKPPELFPSARSGPLLRPTSPKKHTRRASEDTRQISRAWQLDVPHDSNRISPWRPEQEIGHGLSLSVGSASELTKTQHQDSPLRRVRKYRTLRPTNHDTRDERTNQNQPERGAAKSPVQLVSSGSQPNLLSMDPRRILQVQKPQGRFPVTKGRPNEQIKNQADYAKRVVDNDTLAQAVGPPVVESPLSTRYPALRVTAPNMGLLSLDLSRVPSPALSFQVRKVSSSVDMSRLNRPKFIWKVRQNISNLGKSIRPFGESSPGRLPARSKNDIHPRARYFAVSIKYGESDSIAMNTGRESVVICEVPTEINQPPHTAAKAAMIGMKKGIRRGPFFALRESPLIGISGYFSFTRKQSSLTDISDYTVDRSGPRNWPNTATIDPRTGEYQVSYNPEVLSSGFAFDMSWIEQEIAQLADPGQATREHGQIATKELENIVCSLPDFLIRTAWRFWANLLVESKLMQHAKVIPHSVAVVQYYLHCGALKLEAGTQSSSATVVVLNCGEMLVDCVPYLLKGRSTTYSHVDVCSCKTSYMAEMAGFKHAQAEFVKLAAQKLADFNQKLRSKVKSVEIEKRLKILSEYFTRLILPGFQNSGKSWEIPFDLPGRTGGVSSRLTFTDSEVLSCLNPSVSMVRKMLEQTVVLVQPQYEVTHVLLAGPYSASKHLVKELTACLKSVQRRPAKLLNHADASDLCVLGTLTHAISC
ncbi:hypothetical protein NCS52_00088800 [Fusarium sp. LHS14.1]|nr:hypothetical protein NCS52_00088800 [Fusarium sp. LHS14.1]